MGFPKPKSDFTVDQYLALERESERRHEYLDGRILAMAGESPSHGRISVNVIVSLGSQLKGTPCEAFTKDTKIRSGPVGPMPKPGQLTAGLFSYPDIVVVCGGLEFHDDYHDVILNPKTILEVLSESTESFDRGTKFTRFQTWNLSLSDYVLISQDVPQVEHFSKQSDGSWNYRLYTDMQATFAIPSIRCTLRLADVYDRVEFGNMPQP